MIHCSFSSMLNRWFLTGTADNSVGGITFWVKQWHFLEGEGEIFPDGTCQRRHRGPVCFTRSVLHCSISSPQGEKLKASLGCPTRLLPRPHWQHNSWQGRKNKSIVGLEKHSCKIKPGFISNRTSASVFKIVSCYQLKQTEWFQPRELTGSAEGRLEKIKYLCKNPRLLPSQRAACIRKKGKWESGEGDARIKKRALSLQRKGWFWRRKWRRGKGENEVRQAQPLGTAAPVLGTEATLLTQAVESSQSWGRE